MGDRYTVVDPHALVFYGWGKNASLPVDELKNYTRLKDQMLKHTAVRTVMERERDPYGMLIAK